MPFSQKLTVLDGQAYTGIWAVKVNFLMFFYRLTGKIRLYLISWWMVTVVIVACYVSILGVIPWKCTFGTFAHMTGVCASSSGIKQETIDTKVGVALDVFSDFVREFFSFSCVFGESQPLTFYSHHVPHHCALALQNQSEPKVGLVVYLFGRTLHHCRSHCARKRLGRTELLGRSWQHSPSHGFCVDFILAIH